MTSEPGKYMLTENGGPFVLDQRNQQIGMINRSTTNPSANTEQYSDDVDSIQQYPHIPSLLLTPGAIRHEMPVGVNGDELRFMQPSFIRNAPMNVIGSGLSALSDVTLRAEEATAKVLKDIASNVMYKFRKCFVSGEHRDFIDGLYEVETVVATTAQLVLSDDTVFSNIHPVRITAAWKRAAKAMRDLALALSKMLQDCGSEKNVRICRKYVVQVLMRIIVHWELLLLRMEIPVKRTWIGTVRYGDDVNTTSMLRARVRDWLELEPRAFDKVFYKGPHRIVPRNKSQLEDLEEYSSKTK